MSRRGRQLTVKFLCFVGCVFIIIFVYKYVALYNNSVSDTHDYDYPFFVPEYKPDILFQDALQKVTLPYDNVNYNVSSLVKRYFPNWESLDSRPLPKWYDEAKIGIFIHWGVFSVPSFRNEWFWWNWKGRAKDKQKYVAFMKENYRPNFTYADFASEFTAEFFNPTEWADLFVQSGARYVVLTSKHHEGYTNWPSEYSFSWNSKAVGPKRDLVGELNVAVRKKGLRFGLYHSLYEWFHPLYLKDKRNKFSTNYFVQVKTMPELYELVNVYKPDIVWSDGEWEAEDSYWNSTQFLAWLYNDSPVKDRVVTNDRWGKSVRCKHGGFLGCSDRYNPGKLQKRKWENCMTIDKKSWGFRREGRLEDYFTIEELIKIIIETVSFGGNILINIGPAHDGTIAVIYQERLKQMGDWLNVNGEAIYKSIPWRFQKDDGNDHVWYTKRIDPTGENSYVYAILLKWPTDNILRLVNPMQSKNTSISLLGYDYFMPWKVELSGISIHIPYIPLNQMPSKFAWVFKMSGLTNA